KGLSTTKDTSSGKGLSTTKVGGPLHHDSFLDLEPRYRGYPETNGRGLDPCSVPQSNVHHSNEPMLTNVPQSNDFFQTIPIDVPLSNEPMLTNVLLSIEPEPIIGHTEPPVRIGKRFMDFWFKSVAYMEDLYDFSKEFNIGDLYRDMIELKNCIRAYAIVNKFNLEHVLSNEYKIVMQGSFEHAYQLVMSNFAEVRLVDPDLVFDIQTTGYKDKIFTRLGDHRKLDILPGDVWV
ncbi:hypothetical protein GIB67_042596, partial [Kingdonia uniflora]